jgi:hypothetical protein
MGERYLVIITKIMYTSPIAGICVVIVKNQGQVYVCIPLKWNSRMLNRASGLVRV